MIAPEIGKLHDPIMEYKGKIMGWNLMSEAQGFWTSHFPCRRHKVKLKLYIARLTLYTLLEIYVNNYLKKIVPILSMLGCILLDDE